MNSLLFSSICIPSLSRITCRVSVYFLTLECFLSVKHVKHLSVPCSHSKCSKAGISYIVSGIFLLLFLNVIWISAFHKNYPSTINNLWMAKQFLFLFVLIGDAFYSNYRTLWLAVSVILMWMVIWHIIMFRMFVNHLKKRNEIRPTQAPNQGVYFV